MSFTLKELSRELWALCEPGKSLASVHPKGHYFNQIKASPDKPFPTILKTNYKSGGAGVSHWAYPAQLSIPMVKRASSFPDEFQMAGTYPEKWALIGNAVPPLFMRSIAASLRFRLFDGKTPKTYAGFYPDLLASAWADSLTPIDPTAPTVISTFAGCGGSSLGYRMAGFQERLAVEWDKNACETFRLNFPDVPVYEGDILELSSTEALRLAGLAPGELDLLDGSPPCQGFSTSGKRMIEDERNYLFHQFIRLLSEIQPKTFILENVSGMVKGKMKLLFAEILKELKSAGYIVQARLMNTAYFHVPQTRQRMIFIGVRTDFAQENGLRQEIKEGII
jgi:site-specific DNA-cytosine methylase